MKNKQSIISIILVMVMIFGYSALEAQSLKNSKPNIILIMPDDSGYGNHSCFGNPVIKTPNIDTLKKESLLLTRYHSSARCSPSRAKLLRGCDKFMIGVTHTINVRESISLDKNILPQVPKNSLVYYGYVWQMAQWQRRALPSRESWL